MPEDNLTQLFPQDPMLESFLRQFYTMRRNLSVPNNLRTAYQLMRSAQNFGLPHIAATICYLIRSTAINNHSANDIIETLSMQIQSDPKPSTDNVITQIARLPDTPDFSQLNYWDISGLIEDLCTFGYDKAAGRLYALATSHPQYSLITHGITQAIEALKTEGKLGTAEALEKILTP